MDFATELKTELSIKREVVKSTYTLWLYKTSNLDGFTRMGLMADNLDEAQKQLTAIYSEPVIELHKSVAINYRLIQ